MALSVRLDPVLAARVEEEAKRLCVSKSDVVKDALELRLGLKNPYDLLPPDSRGRADGQSGGIRPHWRRIDSQAACETSSLMVERRPRLSRPR